MLQTYRNEEIVLLLLWLMYVAEMVQGLFFVASERNQTSQDKKLILENNQK